jgi:HlyD family secretion protein
MRRLTIVVVIFVLLGAGFMWLSRSKPIPVALKEVGEGKVEATLANTRAGTVEACQRTKLSTIIGGRIEFLGVKEGDKVKKGQLLLKLWNDDQQAQATLAQTQIALAARRVDEACLVAVNAEKEAKRQGELRQKGFVSGVARRGCAYRCRSAARQLQHEQGRCHTGRGQVQGDARRTGARGPLCAV